MNLQLHYLNLLHLLLPLGSSEMPVAHFLCISFPPWALLLEIFFFTTLQAYFFLGHAFISIITSLSTFEASHVLSAFPKEISSALVTPLGFNVSPRHLIVGVRIQEFFFLSDLEDPSTFIFYPVSAFSIPFLPYLCLYILSRLDGCFQKGF